MKVAVLVLILANFAVFAWLRWAPPSNDVADSGLVSAPPAGTQLVLLPADATVPGVTAALSDFCFGPIASATAATALASRFDRTGYSARASAQIVRRPKVWQVLLIGYGDAAAARRAAARLHRKGVRDLFVSDEEDKGGASISLGLFRDPDHARHRAAQIRALGFHPRIQERSRNETRHYLEVSAPASAAEVAHVAGDTVPMARKPCPLPPPATAGVAATAATGETSPRR
ncbi:MAG: SPOR domain-containing protein [Gammaproteobacteria bacterium]